jgi:hypothetical protein
MEKTIAKKATGSLMVRGIEVKGEKHPAERQEQEILGAFAQGRGDLMGWVMNSDNMAPTVSYGDPVLIDRRVDKIKGSGLYAFLIGGRIKIWRVFSEIDGWALFINDNQIYPDERRYLGAGSSCNPQVIGRVDRVFAKI